MRSILVAVLPGAHCPARISTGGLSCFVFSKTIVLAAFGFLPLAAHSAPLTVVNVGAPAINCIFNASCTVVVTRLGRQLHAAGRHGRRPAANAHLSRPRAGTGGRRHGLCVSRGHDRREGHRGEELRHQAYGRFRPGGEASLFAEGPVRRLRRDQRRSWAAPAWCPPIRRARRSRSASAAAVFVPARRAISSDWLRNRPRRSPAPPTCLTAWAAAARRPTARRKSADIFLAGADTVGAHFFEDFMAPRKKPADDAALRPRCSARRCRTSYSTALPTRRWRMRPRKPASRRTSSRSFSPKARSVWSRRSRKAPMPRWKSIWPRRI